jgi:nuclear pore complex protein Nup98-Nup96
MAYHLLKMFSDGQHPLTSALVPASSTPCGLDFRLCWLLYTALRTAGVPSLSKQREEQLHTDFAAQLEAAGLWHYAAFVLLHVEDPKMRTWWVKELLVRNLVVQPTAEQENKVGFVQHQLHIPELWIDEAMSVRARFEGNDEVLADALQKCGRWNEAHATVMWSLAREAILARQYNTIIQLLAPLNNRIQHIAGWETGGAVYYGYVMLLADLEQMDSAGSAMDRRRWQRECSRKASDLIRGVRALPSTTPRDRMAKVEIANVLASKLFELQVALSDAAPETARRHAASTLSDLDGSNAFRLANLHGLTAGMIETLG